MYKKISTTPVFTIYATICMRYNVNMSYLMCVLFLHMLTHMFLLGMDKLPYYPENKPTPEISRDFGEMLVL